MAERVGFEPTIPLQVCRISSAVHSTTLPPLRRAVVSGPFIATRLSPCKCKILFCLENLADRGGMFRDALAETFSTERRGEIRAILRLIGLTPVHTEGAMSAEGLL